MQDDYWRECSHRLTGMMLCEVDEATTLGAGAPKRPEVLLLYFHAGAEPIACRLPDPDASWPCRWSCLLDTSKSAMPDAAWTHCAGGSEIMLPERVVQLWALTDSTPPDHPETARNE